MSGLEEQYTRMKIELCERAERAMIESNIPEGLVRDYIFALILQEKVRLGGTIRIKAPVTKEKYDYKPWPEKEARKLFQGYLEAGFSEDAALEKLRKLGIIEEGTRFEAEEDDHGCLT